MGPHTVARKLSPVDFGRIAHPFEAVIADNGDEVAVGFGQVIQRALKFYREPLIVVALEINCDIVHVEKIGLREAGPGQDRLLYLRFRPASAGR